MSLPPPPPKREPDGPNRPQFKTRGLPESPFQGEHGPESIDWGDIAGPAQGPDPSWEGKALDEIAAPVSAPVRPLPTPERSGDGRAAAVAAWVQESVWGYENRPRGRSAQAHLGPSEIGSDCDRKLVYRLMGKTPVSHGGGVKWPAYVGTGVHSQMEAMSQWLDANRGRFLVEHRVKIIDDELEGTLDLYDRMHGRVIDWKAPSARAVRKYKINGPGDQYFYQGQLYAYGLARQGEKPKEIAIVFMARDASSLEQGLHVEVFDYQPSKAREMIDKYKRLKELSETVESPLLVKPTPSNLCQYCPFYAPGVEGACSGSTERWGE